MKYLILFICLFSTSAYCQKAFIKEIKRRPNPEIFNVKYSTIFYPIITTSNQSVTRRINNKLSEEILESNEGKGNLKNDLDGLIKNGLIDLSYEITYNKNNIFSLNISTQTEEFHHLYRSITFFNFDLLTGKDLQIFDLININKINSLKEKIFQDKTHFLKQYKAEKLIGYLAKKQIDSANYNWAIEQVDSNCINNVLIETFSLSNSFFKIINPCEFPDAAKWMEPDYELKYTYKYMYPFLKPKFQKRLLKYP